MIAFADAADKGSLGERECIEKYLPGLDGLLHLLLLVRLFEIDLVLK